MKYTATIAVEIELAAECTIDTEYDDDGCGDPARSGNSMTGCRGSYPVVTRIEVAPAEAARVVEAYIERHREEIEDEILAEMEADCDE